MVLCVCYLDLLVHLQRFFHLLLAVGCKKRLFHECWVDQVTLSGIEQQAYCPLTRTICVEITGAFHIYYCTFTFYLLHGPDVVSNHSIYLFWLVWGAHGVGIIFGLVLVDSFKVDESVTEGCVRWSTARLNLNNYLV